MRIGWLAGWYRWIEYAAFGRALERRRFAFLPRLAGAWRILVLGEGDGRTAARLLVVAPNAEIDVLEFSPEMIALAKQRTGNSPRVTFRCANALTECWPENHYDAIITNFFLDCFTTTEVRNLIRRLTSVLKPGGIWLIAEFDIPADGWRRIHAHLWIWTMYRFFGITTGLRARELPEIEKPLREAGMTRMEQQQERAGLMISEVWRR